MVRARTRVLSDAAPRSRRGPLARCNVGTTASRRVNAYRVGYASQEYGVCCAFLNSAAPAARAVLFTNVPHVASGRGAPSTEEDALTGRCRAVALFPWRNRTPMPLA